MKVYKVFESIIEIEQNKYRRYGIKGENIKIEDVSSDLEKIKKLVTRCNDYNVPEYQLRDIVIDFLEAEFSVN